METKIETTNEGGKVLAYDGDQIVGQLDFTFQGEVMRIEHTRAFKEGVGVGALLVQPMEQREQSQACLNFAESWQRSAIANAVNDYAINHSLRVLPVCSFAYVWYQRHPQFKDILDEHTGEGVSCRI